MNHLFVDTSGWMALADADDPYHNAARMGRDDWLRGGWPVGIQQLRHGRNLDLAPDAAEFGSGGALVATARIQPSISLGVDRYGQKPESARMVPRLVR